MRPLTLSHMAQWSWTRKSILGLWLGLMMASGGYWLTIKPNTERYLSLKQQEFALRNEFELKYKEASRFPLYQVQLEKMLSAYHELLQQFPLKNEIPQLLEKITQMGTQLGLEFQLFAPQAEQTQGFYSELPVKITVIGTYAQLSLFLHRLSVMKQLITYHELGLFKELNHALRLELIAKLYRVQQP